MDDQPLSTEKAQEPLPVAHVVDGGLRAWSTVVGGWLALFATFGYISAFGVYQDYYTRTTATSTSNISWIGSLQLFFLSAMGLPAGKLLDIGHFRLVMLLGSLIYIFSLFMLSLADPDHYYQILLSQGFGMGIGAGLIYLPSMAVQAHHWRSRRALAMGFVITGSSCGGIVYPIMLNRLFHGSIGFAWGVRASAFMNLGLLAISNCLMSPQLPSKNSRSDVPKLKLRHLFTDTPYILSVVGVFFATWGLFFPYFFLQLFAVLHGLPANFAFYVLTIQNGGSVFGRTLPNLVADKFGVLNTLTFMTFGTGVMMFVLFGVTNIGSTVVFALLYGFFSGAVLSLLAPVTAALSRDVSEMGVRMGLAFFSTSFASLTGNPLDGALLNDKFSWYRCIIFSGTIVLMAVPFLVVARFAQAKRKNSQHV